MSKVINLNAFQKTKKQTLVSNDVNADKAERRAETIRSIRVTGNAYKVKKRLFFNREELSQMMGLYSQMVASGTWRDYAVDHLQGQALFSVFKHANEAPVLMISKQAQPSGKGREYVAYAGAKRLRRAEKLTDILTTIRSKTDL